MDDLDRKLIALLRHNARLPMSSLAAELNVSRATATSRLDKLVDNGVIQGFTITLGQQQADNLIRAIILIEIEGKAADRVTQILKGYPEISALYSTNGRWDIIGELETETLTQFDEILRQIRLIDGVSLTETNILLTTKKGVTAKP